MLLPPGAGTECEHIRRTKCAAPLVLRLDQSTSVFALLLQMGSRPIDHDVWESPRCQSLDDLNHDKSEPKVHRTNGTGQEENCRSDSICA